MDADTSRDYAVSLAYSSLLDEFKKCESLATATSLLCQWSKEELKKAQDNHTGDSSCNTLLHYSCRSNGWYSLSVKLIEEYGLNPQAKNTQGNTALHMACRFDGNLKLVKYLVESCECNHLQPNNNGCTPIHYAITAKCCGIVEYFIKNCGCNSLDIMDIANVAWRYWDDSIIKCLICVRGAAGFSNIIISRLLDECIRNGCSFGNKLRILMDHCSDPNVQDENGDTMLHKICLSPDPLAISNFKMLVSIYKCNPAIENNKGETPLHIICSSIVNEGYTDAKCQVLFYLLMNAIVSPHIKFNSGAISVLSVVCRAILEGHHNPSILHYLISDCGCDPSSDSDIITYTLCNTLCNQGPQCSLDLLLQIIIKYKPYIILENNKKVCVMCCPVKCIKCSFIKFGCESESIESNDDFGLGCIDKDIICKVCQSCHQFLCCSCHQPIRQCRGRRVGSKCDCTLFSKLFEILQQICEDLKDIVDFLLHCYTSITCTCGFQGLIVEMLRALPSNDLSLGTLIHIIKKFGPYPATSSAKHNAMVASLCQVNENSSPTNLVDSNIYTLCQQNPLQAARTILCDMKPYSSNICSLFYYIISHCELDLMSKADAFDNTLLHLACLFYHGDSTLIEYLLSTGKTDPLCVNYYKQTPLTLLSLSCQEHSGNQLNIHKLIDKFGKSKISHPIESYINVIVLGNPGVGKSTLVKVLNVKNDVLFGRFRSVSGVELCTAGIVPHILNDKDMGRIIIHDLAGQVEYYSSHTAVLENLLQGSAAVFVIVVSLANNELAINALRFWIRIVYNVSHKALRQCRAVVVTSYADLPGKAPLLKKLQSILDKHSSAESAQSLSSGHPSDVVYHSSIVSLDCRKLGGTELTSFITILSNVCQTLRDDSVKEMSLYCYMMYDLLTSNVTANGVFVLRDLINLIEQKEDVYLPTDVTNLFDIIYSLSSTGLIVYFGKIADPSKFWIVANKFALLQELNGVLFAPEDFKEYDSTLVSDTGIVKVSKLSSLFPKYDVEMLVHFLEYMNLSQEVSYYFLSSSNLSPPAAPSETPASVQERYLFIPALIKSTNKPSGELSFQFGWSLECSESDSSFNTRFIHLLLFHVLTKYTENKASSDPMNKICHIWNNGIYWNDRGGVSTLLEVFNNNRCLVLLMFFKETFVKNMIVQRKALIEEILLAKDRVSPKTLVNEFIIDNSNGLRYPEVFENYCDIPLYSIVQLAQCCLDGKKFAVTKNSNQANVCDLLNGEEDLQELFESVFAGRNPEDIVKGHLSLSKPISTTSPSNVFEQDESPTLINQSNPQSSTTRSVGTQHIIEEICTLSAGSITAAQNVTSISDQQISRPISMIIPDGCNLKDSTNDKTEIISEQQGTHTNTPNIEDSVDSRYFTNEELTSNNEPSSNFIDVFKSHTPDLLRLISDPHKLANDLWSVNLLSFENKAEIQTMSHAGIITKSSYLLNEFTRIVLSCNKERTREFEMIITFCNVLKNQHDLPLSRIADEIMKKIST